MTEPSMLIQRPAASHCQETSHILVNVFREHFADEPVNEETVQHLAASKCGNRSYHDKYVEKLQRIQEQWHKRIKNTQKIFQHLTTAKEKARLEEEKESLKEKEKWQSYTDLGLPPVPSQLDMFLDVKSLESVHLITPSVLGEGDNNNNKSQQKTCPELPSAATYADSTISSRLFFNKIPSEDNYYPAVDKILPINSTYLKNDAKNKKTATKKAVANLEEKNCWRKCTNPFQREIEKKDVANLQSRADFLKNPRFAADPKFLTNKAEGISTISENIFFKPIPSPVIFENYQLGCAYELKLELKNVTTACRQVRVLQPTTKYFTVDSGEFPDESGLVAPGMSCQYTIRFIPDSLADFNDSITVKTQAIEPLVVPIQARRTPPLLNLPSKLQCGYSLLNNTKTIKMEVVNKGGHGRFCFQLKENKDGINWDEIDYTEQCFLEISPFTIFPSCFQLLGEESITILVTFQPLAIKFYKQHIKLCCDNCSVTNYSIEGFGEVAKCKFSFAKNILSIPQADSVYNDSAKHVVQFERSHPNHCYNRQIVIANETSVPLEYNWNLLQPNMPLSKEHIIDSRLSVFQVSPEEGTLLEKCDTVFDISFNPTRLGSFFNMLSLNINDIALYTEETSNELQNTSLVTVSLKGYAEPNELEVSPCAVIISGKCYVGKRYTRFAKVKNKSNCDVIAKWSNVSCAQYSIEIEPLEYNLATNEELEISITIVGHEETTVNCIVPCEIPFPLHQYCLYFKADFIGPHLKYLENIVDFGLMRYGVSDNRCLTLNNDSPIDAKWRMELFDCPNDASFTYYPSEGTLRSGDSQTVAVHFDVTEPCIIQAYFACIVNGKKVCCVPVHAEVQRPDVCFKKCSVVIDTCYLNVPVTQIITIVNNGLIATKYDWKKLYNADKDVTISFDADERFVGPSESLETFITFCFHSEGEQSFVLECFVEEMLEPILLSVSGVVQGLDVEISIPNVEDIESGTDTIANESVISFGSHVLLGKVACALLLIENKTAIKANFTLHPETFTANTESTKVGKDDVEECRTEEQEQKDSVANLLLAGRGVAFLCSVGHGEIDAYEKKLISIYAYSDMWGEYWDRLVCKIGDLSVRYIPIQITIVGSPLSFQMSKEQPPVVRFGSHVAGCNTVMRNMKINNSSHTDIRLNWQSFVLKRRDDKLIDLDVCIGEVFPLLDADGNEVMNAEAASDDKLFTVLLGEHQGQRCDIPFEVVTKQVMVPANSNATIKVAFKPQNDVKREEKFLGYALGYMCLTTQDRYLSNRYSRLDGIDMLPFALNMTGTVKPAKLYLEACDEEQFNFEVSATDMLKSSYSLQEKTSCSHRYVLVNKTDAIIEFLCHIEKPFKIVKPLHASAKKKTKKLILKPSKNVEICVEFELTDDMVKSLHDDLQLQVNRKLCVEFNNHSKQEYEMCGLVNFPSMHISHNSIDFGVCYVGATRELSFTIDNPSKSLLFWKIETDDQWPQACLDVFSFTPSSGKVMAVDSLDTNSVEIKIQFVAQPDKSVVCGVNYDRHISHNVKYECSLDVTSVFHQQYLEAIPSKVVLHGVGSYDEATKLQ